MNYHLTNVQLHLPVILCRYLTNLSNHKIASFHPDVTLPEVFFIFYFSYIGIGR